MIGKADGDSAGYRARLIGEYFEEEGYMRLRNLVSLIEPLILIVLGVIVGFVAISMFLPLFDLTAAGGGAR